MVLAATTELEAINTLLAVIGEAPVSSLTGTLSVDVVIARSTLKEVSREVQGIGWHFNTEFEVDLSPNEDDEIVVPTNAFQVDLELAYLKGRDIVIRNNRLYDKIEHTYTFTDAVKATVVYGLDFEDLPPTARDFIMVRAARKMQDRVVGSDRHHRYNLRDEIEAKASFLHSDGDQADHSIFNHYEEYRIVGRQSALDRLNRLG